MAIAEKFDALVPTSMDQLITLADRISKSTLIPREYQGKPADCLLAMSMGMEIGLKPIQALQSIAVINNRPCLWGTAARALVMADPRLASLFETEPAEVEKTGHARCEIMRKGHADPFVGEFSIDNARKAQLMGKDSYAKYPGQMLTWRAFHMAARKAFPDIYKGLSAAEEMAEAVPYVAKGEADSHITLSLDAPIVPVDAPELSVSAAPRVLRDAVGTMVTQAELDQSRGEFPDEVQALTTKTELAKVARRRAKTREPQAVPAPVGGDGKPPSVPGSVPVQVVSPPTPAPEACGFCHQTGHGFNDCPSQKSFTADIDKSAAEPESQTLTDEQQAEIMQIAKTLRPKTTLGFLMRSLMALGCEDLSQLPVARMDELIKDMQKNA